MRGLREFTENETDPDDYISVNMHLEENLISSGLTVNSPLLDLRCIDLQCGRDSGVREIPSDIIECKRGKHEEACFAFEL